MLGLVDWGRMLDRKNRAIESAESSAASDEIDLGQLALSLWAGKVWIAAFMLVAVGVGLFYLAITPPTYQADALLQLEQGSASLGLPTALQDLVESSPESVTQIEILRSRMVIGQVVADLNLDWEAEPVALPMIGYAVTRFRLPVPDVGLLSRYAKGDETISLDLLEVPPEWVGKPIELTIIDDTQYKLVLPNGEETNGSVGETLVLNPPGFSLRIGELRGAAGRAFTITQRPELSVINEVRSRLSVSERGNKSGILSASYADADRQAAQRILNAILQSFVDQNIARSAAQAQSGLQFIEQQLPVAQQDVVEAETALNVFRQSQQSVDLSFETQNLLTQITRIENELVALAQQEDEISQRYTPSHPVYQQLLSQRQRLEEQRDALRSETGELPETQQEILNLTRNLEIAQTSYTELLRRSQELRVLEASTVGNVRVIDSAQASGGAVAPRSSLVLALAGVLGVVAGSGFVLVRNWMRRGVQGSEELERIGLPVFATVNYTPSVDASGKNGRKARSILALDDPTDLAVESLRSLRTSLHFGMLDAQTRSIAVTSTAPGAGKSFTSVNLAVVAAQAGQRVCLVDTDMRRGQLRKYFGAADTKIGLAQYLAGEISLEEAVLQGPVPGLIFMPAGEFPPNPSELLMRHTFPELVKRLNEHFDLTIFDTPPVLAVTDPVIIGQQAGATIAVVRFDQTPIGEVEAMKRTLEAAGIRISGAVLNGFDPRKAKAGSYSYSYNYRYAYK
jgi:tyrosine-protein kinase Etk/Wzc